MPKSWKLLAVLVLLAPLCLHAAKRQAKQDVNNPPIAVHFQVRVSDWLESNLAWIHKHPEILKTTASDSPGIVNVPLPSVELFDPKQRSLYRRINDQKGNADFIKTLESGVLPKMSPEQSELHPSLQEYFEMVPALASQKQKLLINGKYTLFAVTNRDLPRCKDQDSAIDHFKPSSKIQVIELDLVKN